MIPISTTHHDFPFKVIKATAAPGPIILSAPHGGTSYPEDLAKTANINLMRTLEDIGTAEITEAATDRDRPAIIARYPRALLDLNRPEDALDPKLWPDAPPPANRRWHRHITAGYGLIPRLSADKQPLYKKAPSISEQTQRVADIYVPYHDMLDQLISHASLQHRQVMLVDIHSMPAGTLAGTQTFPDFVFGDLFGVTLSAELRHIIDAFMKEQPFSWGWNHPFAGGHVTQYYGTRDKAIYCLQIEVNRGLFFKSERIDTKALGDVSAHVTQLLNRLSSALKGQG